MTRFKNYIVENEFFNTIVRRMTRYKYIYILNIEDYTHE